MRNLIAIAIVFLGLFGLYVEHQSNGHYTTSAHQMSFIVNLGTAILAIFCTAIMSIRSEKYSETKNNTYYNEPTDSRDEFWKDGLSSFDMAMMAIWIIFIIVLIIKGDWLTTNMETLHLGSIASIVYGFLLNIVYGIRDDVKLKRRSRILRALWNKKPEKMVTA